MTEERISKSRFQKLTAAVAAGSIAVSLLLTGCGDTGIFMGTLEDTSASGPQEETEIIGAFPDRSPGDVTCRGSYTREFDPESQVAQAGTGSLTNGMLNVFYRLAVNSYRPGEGETGPDFSRPLESQAVPGEEISWQQYFLRQALDSWHTCQALQQKSLEYVEREEPYFDPSERLHREYMTDMPINDILYTKDATYRMAKMHREYLEALPEHLEQKAQALGYGDAGAMAAAEFGAHTDPDTAVQALSLINQAYMYYTEFSYDAEPDDETLEAAWEPSGERTVDIRQVFLVPEHAELDEQGRVLSAPGGEWDSLEARAVDLWGSWDSYWRKSEGTFAAIAHDESMDRGSAPDGGLYANVKPGQLPQALEDWCFDPAREPGDIELIKSEYGWHLVYFCGTQDIARQEAAAALRTGKEAELTAQAREAYPMEVSYDRITLDPCSGQGKVSLDRDLLYPDVAHERISEIPVYIQQDYQYAPYGGYRVGTHGCGITTLAMLSTYMADTILTPGMLAARYGRYNGLHGTDGVIFNDTPPEMGYYLLKKTYDWQEAKQALREGYKVVTVQHKGYFTRGGHYLALSHLNDDDTVVIRDSNVFNYGRLPQHAVDAFPFGLIPQAAHGFWIYDNKVLSIPGCTRCGEPGDTGSPELIRGGYLCPRCRAALERRESFLALLGMRGS